MSPAKIKEPTWLDRRHRNIYTVVSAFSLPAPANNTDAEIEQNFLRINFKTFSMSDNGLGFKGMMTGLGESSSRLEFISPLALITSISLISNY